MNEAGSGMGARFVTEDGDTLSLEEALHLATASHNSIERVKGYSPNQWAYGKSSHVISSVLQDFGNLPALSSAVEDDDF